MVRPVLTAGCFLVAALPALAQSPRLTATAAIDANGALAITVTFTGISPASQLRADGRSQYVARWEIVNPGGHLPPGLNRSPVTRGSVSGSGTITIRDRGGSTMIVLAPPPPPRTPSGMTARMTEVTYSFAKVTTASPRLSVVLPNTFTTHF